MKVANLLGALALLALASSFATAYDPSPLQDICVAINDTDSAGILLVNGKFCKNPSLYTPDDFSFSGFDVPGNTSNQLGVHVNIVTADLMPGLNTLGVSMARIDFAPNGGLNPPHYHPRASEFLRTFVSPGDNVLALHVQEPSATFDPNTFLIHEETCKAKQVDFLAIVAPGTVTFQNYAIKRASTMRQSLRLDAAFQGIQADILFTCVSLLWFLYCRLKQTVVNEYLKGLPPTCSFLVMDMFGRIVDVYSYGVVLLELITGKEAIQTNQVNHGSSVLWARSLLCSGLWESLIDPHLNGEYMKEEMEIMISVARLCLAHSSSRRPTMKTILTLDYSGKKLVIPFFFFFGKPRADVDNPKGKPQLKSINPSATRHLTEKLLA
ncbi:hypothetical protein POTOM_016099 [Populus tomentosa]|uniref:Cupin type-1 domain-containing protein n=1 Tax=Populus tomentosa TaxID=118781 RepID=A0A8X8D8P4_POPTO|nr:hypothetical protein POTOM_016099 [Populus tomentosa]